MISDTNQYMPDLKNLPEDFEDLINLRVAREKWLARAHLSKNGTDGPHINAGRVLTSTEQDLWRPIPQCNNLSTGSAYTCHP